MFKVASEGQAYAVPKNNVLKQRVAATAFDRSFILKDSGVGLNSAQRGEDGSGDA